MKTRVFYKSFYIFLLCCFLQPGESTAQFIKIVSNKFMVGSCPIYINGANTPWESWNDFGGSYSTTKWAQDMVDLNAKGINGSRIWFTCNGAGQPTIAADGTCTVSAQFWTNCDHLFTQAQANKVYIMATLMSFDHTKTANPNSANWQNMLADSTKTRKFINQFLIPFVNRYKTNPYLFSIDLCNEIEWIYENRTTDNWSGSSYAVLQRYIAMASEALHSSSVARADGSHVLTTVGSAGTKWNGTKMRNGSNGTGWQNNPDGNKWSDAALKAQYNKPNTGIDFYSPHFYGWLDQWYNSMFFKSPTDYGMDEKPCMVGEMPSRDPMPTPSLALLTAFNDLKTLGWQGHQPWTSNITTNLTTEVGDLADFGTAALNFKNANTNLIYPPSTCALPLNFLSLGVHSEGDEKILDWTVVADHVRYGNFRIYASSDGIQFREVGTVPFLQNTVDYTFSTHIEETYFYVESSSNETEIDRTHAVYAGSEVKNAYTIIYTSEGDPVLYLYNQNTVYISLISSEGKNIYKGEYQGPIQLSLKNYVRKDGLYILQLNENGHCYSDKIIVR